jgi:hypothetical protein
MVVDREDVVGGRGVNQASFPGGGFYQSLKHTFSMGIGRILQRYLKTFFGWNFSSSREL